jgi:hypothetical protein
MHPAATRMKHHQPNTASVQVHHRGRKTWQKTSLCSQTRRQPKVVCRLQNWKQHALMPSITLSKYMVANPPSIWRSGGGGLLIHLQRTPSHSIPMKQPGTTRRNAPPRSPVAHGARVSVGVAACPVTVAQRPPANLHDAQRCIHPCPTELL